MVFELEIQQALSSSRAARAEIADLRRRMHQARLAVEWQRGRARRQTDELEQTMRTLGETLAELGITSTPLPWTRARDGLVPLE
jgi:hypothetical protein